MSGQEGSKQSLTTLDSSLGQRAATLESIPEPLKKKSFPYKFRAVFFALL